MSAKKEIQLLRFSADLNIEPHLEKRDLVIAVYCGTLLPI